MAYGKAPQVNAQGSFRQRANQYQTKKDSSRRRGGGGGGVYWANQYKPSIDDVDTIRVIEGAYDCPTVVGEGDNAVIEMVKLPFFTFSEHFDGREQKSSVCSGGPFAGSKKKATPCYGCEIFFAGMADKERDHNGKRKKGRMSKRDMYVFTVIDYGVYHNVPQTDFKTGQIRYKDDNVTPWMEWKKCEGQGCQMCRSGAETRRGARRQWQLGWGHYQALLDADQKIGKSCSNCRAADSIRGIAWICASCGDAFVDMSTTTLKAKEINELVGKHITCACGHTGFAQEIIECQCCTNAGGTAKRATIFDVDMNVNRVADPNGGDGTTLSISRWSTPGPIDPLFKDFSEPMDLAKIYTPTPLEKQRELFRYTPGAAEGMQRTPVTAGDAARPWGNQQQQPQQPPNGPQGFPGQNWAPPGMQPQPQQAWQPPQQGFGAPQQQYQQPPPQQPPANPYQQQPQQAAPPPFQQTPQWQPPPQAPAPAPAAPPPGFLPPPK